MLTKSKRNNGKFAKGTSGNLSGRPPGSRNKATLLMEELLEGEAEQLTRKVIELGKAGNIHALQLCLDRLTPPCRDRLVYFELPPMRSVDDISLGVTSIIAAVSEGKVTPQEGEVLSRILAEHANALQTRDIERRMEAVEAKLKQATAPAQGNAPTIQSSSSLNNATSTSEDRGNG
jgi:hypothetical protein